MKQISIFAIIFIFSIISLNAQTWSQVGQTINGGDFYSRCGYSVDLSSDGSIIVIGSDEYDAAGVLNTGRVRVFENISGTWTQIGNGIDGDEEYDYAGTSSKISADGSVIAVGFNGNIGKVKIFHNNSGTWEQVGNTITSATSGNQFAKVIDLNNDGTIVVVSAYSEGKVQVYEYISETNTWEQIGSDLTGSSAAMFGYNVSLNANGTMLAVAEIGNDNNGENAGKVCVYENIEGTWTQVGDNIYGETAGDYLGTSSLNAEGNIMVVGANQFWTSAGYVKVYENISGTWTQKGNKIIGESSGDAFGIDVDINSDGSVIFIGASHDDIHGETTGQASVYKYVSETWQKLGETIYGDAQGDVAGDKVSINDDGTIIAMPYYGSNGLTGKVKIFEQITTNISKVNSKSDIIIYPNPTTGIFRLTNVPQELSNVKITDITGKTIINCQLSIDNSKIDISNQPVGIYFIKVQTENNIITKKIIKK